MNALSADMTYHRMLAPAVLLFGDDPARRALLAERIAQGGGRVVASAPVSDALGRIERQVESAGVVLDVGRDEGAMLDQLLARVDALGEAAGRLYAVLIVPPQLIDVAAARIAGTGTRILIAPRDGELPAGELDAALAELTGPPSPWVEEGGAAGKRRLAELSEEVGRIARMLASMSADEAERVPVEPRMLSAEDGPLVRAFIRLRRMRGQHFIPELFADPAWDILLDLTAARLEGRMVAVSSLCIAAAVPATTALRWISQMTDQAILVRKPDPSDGRRVFIGLSDAATAGMDAYLAAAKAVVVPAG
jgi:CheY-like chemotaxis protein